MGFMLRINGQSIAVNKIYYYFHISALEHCKQHLTIFNKCNLDLQGQGSGSQCKCMHAFNESYAH